MSDLSGKSVLITGGGSGLGAVMAKAFADAGARVWIAGRQSAALDAVAAGNPTITPIVADVTDEGSVAQMFAATGPVDIVIANAGASESAPFHKTDLDAWNRMIAVNLTGVFLTLRDGLAQMRRRDGRDGRGGRLIAVASTAALKGYAYVAPYAAAKHGVVGMVRSLALEIATTEITVNAICPGFLDTDMTARTIANIVEKTGMAADDALSALTKHNPQGKLVDPMDVAQAALWLCGPGSGAINGQAISVSGGEV